MSVIITYAKCVVSGQNKAQFLRLAGELVEETRKEPGNASYQLIKSREFGNIYAFLEQWPDQESLNIHLESAHFKKLIGEISKVTEVPLEITTHEIIL